MSQSTPMPPSLPSPPGSQVQHFSLREGFLNSTFFSEISVRGEKVLKWYFDLISKSFPKLYVYILYPMSAVSFCANIYMTLAVTVERYIAVCRPHQYRQATTTTTLSLRSHTIFPAGQSHRPCPTPRGFSSTSSQSLPSHLPSISPRFHLLRLWKKSLE